jgi:predicted acylesterase/phospholipase RssA
MAASESGATKKRALILASGGVKVAFQAGVLQVWLDEAGLRFDHADGASGGCFNLAMYVQGMSGRQIAENWMAFEPLRGLHVNFPEIARLAFAESLFTYDAYRKNVFPKWGLDWEKIRSSLLSATFNYYNFSRMKLEIVEPAAMNEDKLVACVSLPMWFPPVVIDGDKCIDAVYNTDANLEEAIRRGADELWIIWTVSEAGRWANGFVNNYFQIIEVAANGRLRDVLARIDTNNAAIAVGRQGEFGRPIDVKILRAEVDLNYIIDASADRFTEAVNQGIAQARQWCSTQGIPFNPLPDAPAAPAAEPVALSFRETMKGFVAAGETNPDAGLRRGETTKTTLTVNLKISMGDVERFVTHPQHEAGVTGTVTSDIFGGERPIAEGSFNLLVNTEDPERKLMMYRLGFTNAQGEKLTLSGIKDVRSGPNHDLWTDTTTLFCRVLKGAIPKGQEDTATVVAAGVIRLHLLDFLEELTTFRLQGSSLGARASGLVRFGTLFFGKIWDVYASRILPASPI